MAVTIDGTSGIITPMQGGLVASEYINSQSGFKNRIINGNMRIDQRNAGVTITPTNGQYSVDRWSCYLTQASKFCIRQAPLVTLPQFTYCIHVASLSAYSVIASDYFLVSQCIEGFNVADLNWGYAGAVPITLSFWVYSSLTGVFGGSIQNYAVVKSYPFTYTINSANTWEYKTITIPGDTTGVWIVDSSGGMWLNFGLGVGSSYAGTANVWSNTNDFSAIGAVSLVGTNGANWYITGVQIEKGSNATSFERLDYGRELALCQRYYQYHTICLLSGYNTAGGTIYHDLMYPVQMRTAPTSIIYSAITYSNASALSKNWARADHLRSQILITATGSGYASYDWETVGAEF